MSADRHRVLGLARPRTDWFAEVGRWSTTGAAPVDFVRCVSAAEVRARLAGHHPCSALLADPAAPGFDRDLADAVVATGACVIVVDPPPHLDCSDLGVATALPAGFTPAELVRALRDHAPPAAPPPTDVEESAALTEAAWGRLIAVTGPSGTGVSTVAMAAAQGLARNPGWRSMVLLADLSLDADLAMLHDSRDVVPALQELVEAHGAARPGVEQVRSSTFDAVDRGYHLLLGLRRHRDWTAIRRRAFEATLASLRGAYRLVVADVDDDIEGEADTGSADVEDRNLLARHTLHHAELVVCVGNATTKGIHSLARSMRRLGAAGINPEAMVPVLNRAGRGRWMRAEATAALAGLTDAIDGSAAITNPTFLAERREVEDSIREAAPLPAEMEDPLRNLLWRRLRSLPPSVGPAAYGSEAELVVPGSLGAWTEGSS